MVQISADGRSFECIYRRITVVHIFDNDKNGIIQPCAKDLTVLQDVFLLLGRRSSVVDGNR